MGLKAASANMESFDVYCFGHLMFEMATGLQLNATLQSPSDLPDNMPDETSNVNSKGVHAELNSFLISIERD